MLSTVLPSQTPLCPIYYSDTPVSHILPSQISQCHIYCRVRLTRVLFTAQIRLPCVLSTVESDSPVFTHLYCQVRLLSVLSTAQSDSLVTLYTAKSDSPVSYLLPNQVPQCHIYCWVRLPRGPRYLLKSKTTQCHIYCWVRLALNNLHCPKTSLLLLSLSFNPGWYNFSTKKTFS